MNKNCWPGDLLYALIDEIKILVERCAYHSLMQEHTAIENSRCNFSTQHYVREKINWQK